LFDYNLSACTSFFPIAIFKLLVWNSWSRSVGQGLTKGDGHNTPYVAVCSIAIFAFTWRKAWSRQLWGTGARDPRLPTI